MELHVCLQDARGELRSTRSSDQHHCCKLSKIVNNTIEIIEATEWNHQCALNSIAKLATEQLELATTFTFIVLGSMEMIAQLRVASVLHLGVVIPMR
jgi:hypothetical protein